MDINDNTKEPGGTNNTVVPDENHATPPEEINFKPGSPNDKSTFFRTFSSLTGNYMSSTGVTPNKGNTRKNMVKMAISP